jgi:RimJ/RimL family protein N-acetyltransferase
MEKVPQSMVAHNRVEDIPELETERLRLRPHRLEDFDDCLAMWSDPEVTRYIGGKPLSGEEVWARILRYAGHWRMLGFGYWLVEEKGSNLFVGEVGFADFKRQIAPSFEGIPEIGWALIPWAHGKGYATEAVRGAVEWGDGHFGAVTTGCLINPDNAASIRVAQKGGYKEFCRTFYKEHPAVVYRR